MEMDLESAIKKSSGKEDTYPVRGIVKKETQVFDDKGLLSKFYDGRQIERCDRHQVGELVKVENAIIEIDCSTTGYSRFLQAYYANDELPDNDEFLASFAFPISDLARIEFSLMKDFSGNLSKGCGKFRIMTEHIEKIALSHLFGKSINIDILPESYEHEHNVNC